MKNDEGDAVDLIDMLGLGRLPEAWIAPPATRELRELVRHRAKLVGLRSHCRGVGNERVTSRQTVDLGSAGSDLSGRAL